ncbi:L-ascorbate oxidase homolog [Cornus florida]|uniref:L-ascorbate oxidase homolog n=1 Tax=Cornus florida TaxID=4283 RepID=UPI00289ADCAF|nr:L-ascorbate oxidase homolog [Cornus florida]
MAGRGFELAALLCLALVVAVRAEDPYLFYTWNVTYGTISPLGVPTQAILINGEFPGPKINCTTNNNIFVNVFNNLDEPFLLTWHGIQQRGNSWLDGTPGTMCPIQPGQNFTYRMQFKDQIGSYYYYPSLGLQKAAGGIGAINIHSRIFVKVTYNDRFAPDLNFLLGDWFNKGHKALRKSLDAGRSMGKPDGLQINGKSGKVGDDKLEPLYTVEAGKSYRFRYCNVGLKTSVNIRLQGHQMKLVELEGSHTVKNKYNSVDLHVGQCMTMLVIADQEPKDYYLVVSSRFVKPVLTTVGIIRYVNGKGAPAKELPPPPPEGIAGFAWSINQFKSFRWNLTASAARPNPQGSYHYGQVPVNRTIRLVSSKSQEKGKLRYAINGVSHVDPDTPLKLAEYYGVGDKIYKNDTMPKEPPADPRAFQLIPNVLNTTLHEFVEIVFENREKTMQTWHFNGYAFFGVNIEPGRWSPERRKYYNLIDAVSRHTIPVFPGTWASILFGFENTGMWNLKVENAERSYLGQQLYFSCLSPERSIRDENSLPDDVQLCGIVKDLPKPPPYAPYNARPKKKKSEASEAKDADEAEKNGTDKDDKEGN